MFRDQDQKLLEALILREKAERGGKQRRHTVNSKEREEETGCRPEKGQVCSMQMRVVG